MSAGADLPGSVPSVQPELVRRLRLADVIVHRIPKANSGLEPRYSDVLAPESDRVVGYFQRRLHDVLGRSGVGIEAEPALESVVRDAVVATLKDKSTLPGQSKVIAKRLYESQDSRSPEGIVVITLGEIDKLPCVCVLKLEHEQGVTAEEVERVDGQLQFELVVHDELVLTEKTVLFKCALFKPTSDTDWTLEGLAADLQVTRPVADFFLTKFLGCKLVEAPSIMTERFLAASEGWIATVESDEDKNLYETALVTHLQSQLNDVDPVSFARNTLRSPQERDQYLNFLVEHGSRRQRFPKDTSTVAGRIKRVAHEFASGLKVVARPDVMRERLRFEETEKGSRAIIEDDLKRTHSSG
jgi:37-kD nucleoid-associated bacterial protein